MKRLFRNDPLFADFFEFAGRRAGWASLLIILGGLLEGFGIMLLVPVIGIVLSEEGAAALPFIDTAFQMIGATTSAAKLGWVACGFAFLMFARQVVIYHREMLIARLENGFTASIRRRIFDLVAAQPWDVAASLEQGRIAHSLGKDLERSTESSSFCLRVIGLAFSFAVQLVIALSLAPLVTLGVIVFGGLVFMFLGPMRARARRIGVDLMDNDYQMFTSIAEFLRGLKPAKAHGTEKSYLTELDHTANSYADSMLRFQRDMTISDMAIQGAMLTVALGALVVGHLWLQTPTATLVVVLLILSRFTGPLKTIQIMLQHLAHARTAYVSLMRHTVDLERTVPDRFDRSAATPLTAAPSFSLTEVAWHAPEADLPILSSLSADIPAGKVTAIAGPSGSGKTTLCDLLVGLYAPSEGSITLDGKPFDPALRRQLQASLSYVGQESGILQSDLRAMLTWGTEGVTDADIWAELERVGVAAQVRKDPDGLDQQLRGDVSRFSGGERQRMRLARALLRNPRLIVLDEATNALDPASENRVLEAIFAARDGATVIMVSHREETVGLADHVIRLDAAASTPPHEVE